MKFLLCKLYEECRTISETANLTCIKINSAQALIRRYKQNFGTLKENKRGGNRIKLLTSQVLSLIEFYIESQRGITLKAIKTELLRENDINISTSSIENGLRKLKITLKMASSEIERMNDSRTLGLRQKYAQVFTKWIPQQRSMNIGDTPITQSFLIPVSMQTDLNYL